MDAHYSFLAAFDAPSSNQASFASISMSSPPDFAFTIHNAPPPPPSLSFPHEFAMLQHVQQEQQEQQQQQQHTYTTTPHTNHKQNHNHIRTNNDSSPRSKSQSHLAASASATDFDFDYDFDFARSLHSIRRSSTVTSRSSSSSSSSLRGGGHGHGHRDGGLGLGFLGEEPERLRGGGGGGQAPTESEAAVAETIVRARKSWKTVKGRSEPVWPPHLEKALVQALLQYKPHDSRYVRALGRFPKRNRYISDFIFAETGVRRTPKQVGSRLQQLKDVSCGKMLLNHVAQWSLSPPPSRFTTGPVSAASTSPSSIHHPDLDVTLNNDAYGHGRALEGSQSPVSPLGAGGPGLGAGFAPASSTMTRTPAESDPHATHMELALSQGNWFTYAGQMHVR